MDFFETTIRSAAPSGRDLRCHSVALDHPLCADHGAGQEGRRCRPGADRDQGDRRDQEAAAAARNPAAAAAQDGRAAAAVHSATGSADHRAGTAADHLGGDADAAGHDPDRSGRPTRCARPARAPRRACVDRSCLSAVGSTCHATQGSDGTDHGSVRARATIRGGKVINVEILSSSPRGLFDSAVRNAMMQYGCQNNGDQETQADQEFVFKITE